MSKTFLNWNVSPKEAVIIQKKLRKGVKLTPIRKKIINMGGADVSMNMFSKKGYAGFVVLSQPGLAVISESVVQAPIEFPYIPGLLSFREIPMLLRAWRALKKKPDVILVDGVGIAHPRRMGIATHLGLILEIPTIGCAKKILTGVYEEPANVLGAYTYIYENWEKKEILGAALRSKKNVKPIFISPGHLITVSDAISVVKKCILRHRLPEPTRQAHLAVNRERIASLADINGRA